MWLIWTAADYDLVGVITVYLAYVTMVTANNYTYPASGSSKLPSYQRIDEQGLLYNWHFLLMTAATVIG